MSADDDEPSSLDVLFPNLMRFLGSREAEKVDERDCAIPLKDALKTQVD